MRRSIPPWGLAIALLGAASHAGAQTGYIAFGDSITAGVGDDPANVPPGYPPRLEALLDDAGTPATILNAGHGGENTVEGVTRIDQVLADAAAGNDVLLLMEGTNDISNGISVETTRFDLQEMARKAENAGLSVVQATTIPRYPSAKIDADNVANLTLDENIRDQAGHRNRLLADPFEVFSAMPNLFATYYYQPPAGTSDPVGHPNAAGYDQLAQIFFDVLREHDTVAPVTGLTSPLHGTENVSPNTTITVDVWDFGAGINLAATRLLVNGSDAGVDAVGDTRHAQLSYQPPLPLSGVVRVGLRSADLAVPTPNGADRDVARFVIAGTVSLAGDLDRDGRVDGADLVQFARRFGASEGDPLFLAAADFNADRTIDGSDLAILASNFGKSTS